MAELIDTIDDMVSIDPRKRLRAEHTQALIRLAELDWVLERGVDLDSPFECVERHRNALLDYVDAIEERMEAADSRPIRAPGSVIR